MERSIIDISDQMKSNPNVSLPFEYLSFLKEHGTPLDSIGINGYALSRQRALQALEILARLKLPVLGGDVIAYHNGMLTLTYDNWYINGPFSDSQSVELSHKKARDFIASYDEPSDGTVLYQLITQAEKAA